MPELPVNEPWSPDEWDGVWFRANDLDLFNLFTLVEVATHELSVRLAEPCLDDRGSGGEKLYRKFLKICRQIRRLEVDLAPFLEVECKADHAAAQRAREEAES